MARGIVFQRDINTNDTERDESFPKVRIGEEFTVTVGVELPDEIVGPHYTVTRLEDDEAQIAGPTVLPYAKGSFTFRGLKLLSEPETINGQFAITFQMVSTWGDVSKCEIFIELWEHFRERRGPRVIF
ncbi:hypothetical protein NLU13_8127 [Sarocladium strictum]|uniref:Uncharacterized protein n=1 Tax=Sarocladium strictum TaxID=5046 RepID=A0AA39GB27_SARSR|nr:hypothetical protein NLU13_8127 [Sarocladium strictum]